MPNINRNTQPVVISVPAPPRSNVKPRRNESQAETFSPTSHDLRRFTERRRAQDLGYELPLDTSEAAEYVGFHRKSVERMARLGEIPAHPVSGVLRKTWRYYPSELDSWLRARVNSRRYPCSPNGKDSEQ